MAYLLTVVALLAAATSSLAQSHLNFRTVSSQFRGDAGTTLTLDAHAIAQLADASLVLDNVPVDYQHAATLSLKPSPSPIDSRTMIESGGTAISVTDIGCWSGAIADEPGSRVYVCATNGYLFMSIVHADGRSYVLAPDLMTREKNNRYRFISQSDLLSQDGVPGPLRCINEDRPEMDRLHSATPQIYSVSKPLSYRSLLEAEIAVEADSSFYAAAGGSDDLVTAYVNALFAMSSAIYEDEAQITFHIPWLKLWPSGDPYNVKGDAYALPDTVRHYWQAHYANVQRDIAHVMTSIGYGGGGFGWFGACSAEWSYSVSSPKTHAGFPTFAFTYDAYIVSHEIGHNFGLPHSHNCYWAPPLDTCYTNDDSTLRLTDACYGLPVTPRKSAGTIMSYCANANFALSGNDFREYKLAMTFSKRVADTLRRNAQTYACITEPPEPTIRLIDPRGGTAIPGDTTISVAWTGAHVSSVRLRYSTNAGSDWSVIRDDVPVTDGSVPWTVPNIATMNGMVEIADESNPSVADTSLLPITVVVNAAVVTGASEGSEQRYEIFDILGNAVGGGLGSVPARSALRLPHGVYIVRVSDRDSAHSYRVSY